MFQTKDLSLIYYGTIQMRKFEAGKKTREDVDGYSATNNWRNVYLNMI
jgi:hypothetical protein